MQRNSASPPRRPHRHRSISPETREYSTKGGGRSSSRQRSPNFYVPHQDRPQQSRDGRGGRNGSDGREGRDRRDGRDGREVGYGRDNGYGGGGGGGRVESSGRGGQRDRDSGWGNRERRKDDDDYGEKEREKERQGDRKRYDELSKRDGEDDEKALAEAAKPNFGSSGLLAKETNTVKGVELKYNEPPEARKPLKNWRLYVFKGKEQLDLIHIYRQSAYLVGRDQVVTDIPIAHPSCSKQHAAIQFRQISEKNEYGEVTTSVKPFIIDLDSTNGTHVNDQEIPKSRYYELRNSDVIKFGTSSREYVLLHEDAS